MLLYYDVMNTFRYFTIMDSRMWYQITLYIVSVPYTCIVPWPSIIELRDWLLFTDYSNHQVLYLFSSRHPRLLLQVFDCCRCSTVAAELAAFDQCDHVQKLSLMRSNYLVNTQQSTCPFGPCLGGLWRLRSLMDVIVCFPFRNTRTFSKASL